MHEAESTTNSVDSPNTQPSHSLRIKLKVPQRQMNLRSRRASSALSGSEYHASEKSDLNENPPDEEPEPQVEYSTTRAGRKIRKGTYIESSDGEEDNLGDSAANLFSTANDRRITRTSKRLRNDSEEHEEKHLLLATAHGSRGQPPNCRTSLKMKKRRMERNLMVFVFVPGNPKLMVLRLPTETENNPSTTTTTLTTLSNNPSLFPLCCHSSLR
jgi:hypothetical protein